MPNTDVDLVSLDRRLSAILGQDYNAESMDVDLRSLDKRVEEAEVAPPIDYRTGSIDYSKAFQDMYDCEIFIDSDGRFLLMSSQAWNQGASGIVYQECAPSYRDKDVPKWHPFYDGRCGEVWHGDASAAYPDWIKNKLPQNWISN